MATENEIYLASIIGFYWYMPMTFIKIVTKLAVVFYYLGIIILFIKRISYIYKKKLSLNDMPHIFEWC